MSKRSKQRKNDMALHNHKYTRHYLTEGYYCFYCGDPAECLDHVPPVSLIGDLKPEYRRLHGIPAALVPACLECNSALGDRRLLTVVDRLLYLESFYDAKFKKQQAMWTEDEIQELGYVLQNVVRSKQEKLQRYIHKIRGIQMRQIKVETHPTLHDCPIEDVKCS